MLCTFLLARKININNNDLLNKLRGFSSISENYHDTSCKSSPFLQGKNVFIHCSIRIDVAFPISRRPEDQFAVVSSFFFFLFNYEEQEDVPLSWQMFIFQILLFWLSGRIHMVWDQKSDCNSKENVPWDSSRTKWNKQVITYLFIILVIVQCISQIYIYF